MMEQRFTSPKSTSTEVEHESRLRPKDFSEYIGQTKVVENIDLMVRSANKRSAAMDHVLLSGPPGLGKTSLAMIIAKALESELHVVSGPAIEKKGDLAAVLTNLNAKDVLVRASATLPNVDLRILAQSAQPLQIQNALVELKVCLKKNNIPCRVATANAPPPQRVGPRRWPP